jgi:hypothetical protein
MEGCGTSSSDRTNLSRAILLLQVAGTVLVPSQSNQSMRPATFHWTTKSHKVFEERLKLWWEAEELEDGPAPSY